MSRIAITAEKKRTKNDDNDGDDKDDDRRQLRYGTIPEPFYRYNNYVHYGRV